MDARRLWIPGQINLAQSHQSGKLRGPANADRMQRPKVLFQDNQNRKGASETNKEERTVHQNLGNTAGNGVVHANVGQNVTPHNPSLGLFLYHFFTYNELVTSQVNPQQHKQTTNTATMVMAPLAPPAAWI
jgi:hypothetical protein